MGAENILCNRDRPPAQVLADVGEALLRIKNERGFSLVEFGHEIGVSRVMISQYIAGEAEMGFLKWERARRRFPELTEYVEETSAERAMRARQRALELGLPSARQDRREMTA